ncbi:MAG: hypothetical protein JWP27_769 [Flaviaesturariibacter sp.]|nr:hypothetical protein [Flaviaesturariibacter sp.]
MEKKRAGIDIVNEVLEACLGAGADSPFVVSLYKQYVERGSLSRRQLQGLLAKATKAAIPGARLATLDALIKKMPVRSKSEMPVAAPLYEKDQVAGEMIASILARYPAHKRVLYLQARYSNNEVLSPSDLADLKRFHAALK